MLVAIVGRRLRSVTEAVFTVEVENGDAPGLRLFTNPFSTNVTPLRDGLATPQRELTRKNQTVRFDVVLLMRYGLNTRTRRHIQLAVHRTVLRCIVD